LIENKTLALTVAVITFIIGTAAVTSIIFYLLGYPLTSIPEHQLYFAFAILISAALASLVYGRGSNDRAKKAAHCVEETLKIQVDHKTMWKILRAVEQLPVFVVRDYVLKEINVFEEYDEMIIEYARQISPKDMSKIKKIVDTPVPELQKVLMKLYLETNLEQFKVLASSDAEKLIQINLDELKKALFE
jgi:hypothetical protein